MPDKDIESIGQFRSPEFKNKDSGNNTKHIIVATLIAAVAALGAYELGLISSSSTPVPTKVVK